MHAFVFWADVLMIPWKMMMSPVADSLNAAALLADLDGPRIVDDLPSHPVRLG